MKHSMILIALLFSFLSIGVNAQSASDSLKTSVVPTADEMRDIANNSEKGLVILNKMIDAIDLSFLKDIDPSITDDDIPLTKEDKEQVKEELKKGSESIQNINFEKIEELLKSIESVIGDFDSEDLKDSNPKK